MPSNVEPNQEFLKFISEQGNKKRLQNLEIILDLEKDYPGIFSKAMKDFDRVKLHKNCFDENGMPKKISWKEALEKVYFENEYEGVTKENFDIAELYGRKGLSQKVFDTANNYRQIAEENDAPEHILGKPIGEESILESIEKIKNQTESELINGKQIMDELYDRQFTYEWLNKKDPHNGILGLYCSCCATIVNSAYGADIARESIIAKDVQNLVVRDVNGNIISKGTMYVNKDKDYAVINDFELDDKYRNHEIARGRYKVDKTSKEEQQRELIFKAFQRGIRAFVDEYDKQNPNKPLKQINVGMGYNRLKKQVERFKRETSNLTVPIEYNFADAMENEQYILYEREEKQNGNEEKSR